MSISEIKTIVVIGGGPAGMAASYAAKSSGTDNVILLERHEYLGGVLPQCIHNGFGTQIYNEDYTGGEYAALWKSKVESCGVDVRIGTTVMNIEKINDENINWIVNCVSAQEGRQTLKAHALIVATGCRERTLPQLNVTGSRPAGIFTAGAAQAMMNLNNYLPGKTAAILGSGDIGLIMARRMTLEGIKVKLILGEKSTGLPRNIIQCVEDFDIPMMYGWTVISTHGYQRLKGIKIAPFDDEGSVDISRKEYVPCDTLLVAAGLIPEIEVCGEYIPGMDDGLFICGNAYHVYDLVDNVTEGAIETGIDASEYVNGSADISGGLSEIRWRKATDTYMNKEGNMVCTVCPKGCMMQVNIDPFSVLGNDCQRGVEFARSEMSDPKRIVTTIVKVDGGLHPVLSVKTNGFVGKKDMGKIIEHAKTIRCNVPVSVGDVVSKNVAGLNIDLVATNSIDKESDQ